MTTERRGPNRCSKTSSYTLLNYIFIWATRVVSNGDTRSGGIIPFSFKLQVEPHHKLLGLCVIDHFRTLNDAAFNDLALRIVGHFQRNPLILPVIEIFRRIDMPPDMCPVSGAAGNLMFAKPVIGALVEYHTAAMRINVHALVVFLNFTRLN